MYYLRCWAFYWCFKVWCCWFEFYFDGCLLGTCGFVMCCGCCCLWTVLDYCGIVDCLWLTFGFVYAGLPFASAVCVFVLIVLIVIWVRLFVYCWRIVLWFGFDCDGLTWFLCYLRFVCILCYFRLVMIVVLVVWIGALVFEFALCTFTCWFGGLGSFDFMVWVPFDYYLAWLLWFAGLLGLLASWWLWLCLILYYKIGFMVVLGLIYGGFLDLWFILWCCLVDGLICCLFVLLLFYRLLCTCWYFDFVSLVCWLLIVTYWFWFIVLIWFGAIVAVT